MTLRTRRYLREVVYIWDDKIVQELIDRGWKRNITAFRARMRKKNNYRDVLTKRFGKFLIRAYIYMSVNSGGSQVMVNLPHTATRALDFPGDLFDLKTHEPKIRSNKIISAFGHTLETYANAVEKEASKIALEFSKVKRKPQKEKDVFYRGSNGKGGYSAWRKDISNVIQYVISRYTEKEDMSLPVLVSYLEDYGMLPTGLTKKQLYNIAKIDVQKLLKQGVLGQGEDRRGRRAYFWTNKLPRPMTPR